MVDIITSIQFDNENDISDNPYYGKTPPHTMNIGPAFNLPLVLSYQGC